ncbi:DUF58 domain-containing protein [Desulfoluna spongiiphila]|uniref:DUF58 domain-containing protein n=1 Tax=Desulfoluna spongiiphila TaxID=419481 RepID=UPI00125442F0|nr:DUF58 domain-containing protein [Desulfoluna spongiiphila]VVS93904.1 domain of unknown function duf58 [Desulfoluna spongiiphila]
MKGTLGNAVRRVTSRGHRRPLPLGIKGMRIYILPTGRGVLFACAVVSMIAGSMNYSNNPGFLFAFLLVAMAMMSTLYTQKNIKELTLVSEKHTAVFAGERLWFELAVKSDTAPRYNISAGFKGQGRQTLDIATGETVTFRLPLDAPWRGRFKPGPLVVSSTYPFGLFRTWVTLRLDTEYLVFPKPLSHPFVSSPGPAEGEGIGASPQSGAEDFKELRSYRAGDPLNRIAWKTLARGQGVWTKTFESERSNAVYISWDLIRTTQRETRISHLCHLVLEAHRQGVAYGLMAPGITIKPGAPGSIAHRDHCLSSLAVIP